MCSLPSRFYRAGCSTVAAVAAAGIVVGIDTPAGRGYAHVVGVVDVGSVHGLDRKSDRSHGYGRGCIVADNTRSALGPEFGSASKGGRASGRVGAPGIDEIVVDTCRRWGSRRSRCRRRLDTTARTRSNWVSKRWGTECLVRAGAYIIVSHPWGHRLPQIRHLHVDRISRHRISEDVRAGWLNTR